MAQVIRPQKTDDTNNLFTIGGAVAGGILGGPQGAVTGAGVGQTAGGIINPAKSPAPSLGSDGQASAMMRKQQQMSQDNLATLKHAEATLPTLPEDLRQQYAPAIIKARMMEEQKRGLA